MPLTQLVPGAHWKLQLPQLESVFRLISHPSASVMLQSAKPALQNPMRHVIGFPPQKTEAFALTSGTAPFQRLQRSDGTGAYVVHSGTGDAVGLVTSPLSPWLRLAVSSGPSSPMSYTILETAL